ncbi:MAG: phosphate signaling complex protein PhoU [Candidatus Latescibacterota bacterium]|nr:MAG: phosphate signaling complex protein PhoU [Candidatus Latescibacterota bacterium]
MVRLKIEIERLKKRILSLSAAVEESVRKAVTATEERDSAMAHQVLDGDAEIDALEVELEEECLKILALHQPVAMDLRFIIAVLKINNDLERIGDQATNIAERAVYLAQHKHIEAPPVIPPMVEKVRVMLRESLDALVNMDTNKAAKVRALDGEVDELHRSVFARVQAEIRERPDQIEGQIQWFSVSRCLERIADQATNIAEDVIYMMEGEIVRHQKEDYRT